MGPQKGLNRGKHGLAPSERAHKACRGSASCGGGVHVCARNRRTFQKFSRFLWAPSGPITHFILLKS